MAALTTAMRNERLPRVATLALLVLVALVMRLAVIGNPIVHSDEQFYFTAAHGWWRGALPYVDIWDRKPIGLFLLYLPAGAPRNPAVGVIVYQSVAMAAAVGTAWLVVAIARAAGMARGAVPAAILYLIWLDLADGQGGQAPVLYNAAMALAALLIVHGQGRRLAGIGAMGLVGAALQIKYSVVFEGAWFGAWLLWRDRDAGAGGRIAYAAALVGAAVAPTLIAAASYAVMGEGAAWWYANVVSILHRGATPWREQLGNLATCLAILLVPVVLAWLGWRRTAVTAADRDGRRFLGGWLLAAILGFAVFGTWFDHYTLPILVPAAVGAAAMLDRGRWRWGLLVAAALAGQASLLAARTGRGTPAAFARLVAAVGHGPGCLYVYSGPSMLYPFTGRCAATRFVYPSHLTRVRESTAIGVDPLAELRRLMATRPAVVVVGQPFRGEAPASRALIRILLQAGDYRLSTVVPLGRDRLGVYTRR